MSAPVEWLKNTQEWLDGHGPMAWISAMVLGFIFIWPVGLFILFYMIGTNRMWKRSRNKSCGFNHRGFGSSGNVAFDKYRDETLRRLEDEQKSFTDFLEQLRAAKDQAEFDQFMTNRARRQAAPEAPEAPEAPASYTAPRAPGFGDAAPA